MSKRVDELITIATSRLLLDGRTKMSKDLVRRQRELLCSLTYKELQEYANKTGSDIERLKRARMLIRKNLTKTIS